MVLRSVESSRRSLGLHESVRLIRRQAASCRRRSPEGRRILRRAIAALDSRMPGGGNCVRRTLLEMRLDSGAAHESLYAGFRAGGAPRSGHAWLASDPPQETFDAVIAI